MNIPILLLVQMGIHFSFFSASYANKDKLDLHIQSGFVYWTESSIYTSYRGIFRAKTNGGGYRRVVTSGVGQKGIQGLAVDWIAGMNLFNHRCIDS